MEEEKFVRAPRNTWEMFRWLLFEPEYLKEFDEAQKSKNQRISIFGLPTLFVFFLIICVWTLTSILVVIMDLPTKYPDAFNSGFRKHWQTGNYIANYQLVSEHSIIFFILVMITLTYGLFFKKWKDSVLALVLYGPFLTYWSAITGIGLFSSIGVGLTGYFISEKHQNQVLPFSLFLGLLFIFEYRNLSGVVIVPYFLIFVYRIPLYIYYSIKSKLKTYTLCINPHFWDNLIAFPIWKLKERLTKEAIEVPENATNLVEHILKRNKLQRPLAHHLLHAQTAGFWRKNRLQPDILKVFIEVPDDKDKKFRPSAAWYEKLHAMRQARMDSARQNNIHTRLQYFDTFRRKLAEFRQQNLLESPVWNHYYFDTLDLWVKSADAEYERLKLESQNQEPICPNLYRGGEQLDPRYDKALFFGREDLRNTFESKVVTATSMPLFFIQGQRRIGKSSLIRFLPEFLDSGFVLVYLDLQSGINSVAEWLQFMRRAIWKTVRKKEQPPALPDGAPWDENNWLACWRLFQQELKIMANEDGRRIILAMDEYEELHRCLQSEPEQGGQLLGAMRSFSQGQNRVIFLFAGADFLTELKNPNWNEYFVQAVPLIVDYLSKEDTFRLIQVVPLQYPPALLERMYNDTQGHPCLLQKICQEMVNIANASGKREMTQADYDAAIGRVVMQPHNGVVDVFWGQFCTLRNLKDTVNEILAGRQPTDERRSKVLKIHGFVIEENKAWRLRVPLFERWVREFGDL